MSKEIFNTEFLTKVETHLIEYCGKEGRCIIRSALCDALELDHSLENTLGVIVRLGYIPGFKIWMGPNGGIGREDIRPPKKERSATTYNPTLDSEWLTKLRDALNSHVTLTSGYVPRKKIAAIIGTDDTKTQNAISAALKLDEFKPDFGTKKGKGGGIYRLSRSDDLSATTSQAAPTVEDEIESKPAEPVEEATQSKTQDEIEADMPEVLASASEKPEVQSDGPLARLRAFRQADHKAQDETPLT